MNQEQIEARIKAIKEAKERNLKEYDAAMRKKEKCVARATELDLELQELEGREEC